MSEKVQGKRWQHLFDLKIKSEVYDTVCVEIFAEDKKIELSEFNETTIKLQEKKFRIKAYRECNIISLIGYFIDTIINQFNEFDFLNKIITTEVQVCEGKENVTLTVKYKYFEKKRYYILPVLDEGNQSNQILYSIDDKQYWKEYRKQLFVSLVFVGILIFIGTLLNVSDVPRLGTTLFFLFATFGVMGIYLQIKRWKEKMRILKQWICELNKS